MRENAREQQPPTTAEAPFGRSTKARTAALAAFAAALPLTFLLWGYTVDDALITARVASHLASGHGYRFNAAGPIVDAVTPLGFGHVLAAFGTGAPLDMLFRARCLGVAAWLGAAAYWGLLAGRSVGGLRLALLLLVLALSAPLAAWSGAGMETGLVTALATVALRPGYAGVLAAGIAAGWRPELLPWALVLTTARSLPRASSRAALGKFALALALVMAPAVLAALVRYFCFGSPAPLSVLAKPSDLAHGLRYALAAFVFGGAPLLCLAPRALFRADRETRALVFAGLCHFAALVLAGGDWMALFRLAVPALPTVLLAGARLAAVERLPWFAARAALATASSMFVLWTTGLPARHVLEHRLSLIERARTELAGAHAVATLDAGWVGAATNAPVVDLAGVTDPRVAALPGGHTSKRIPEELLRSRGADVWVLLLAPGARVEADWRASHFARAVEQRLASLELASEYRVSAVLPLGGTRQDYLVVRRSRDGLGRAPAALP